MSIHSSHHHQSTQYLHKSHHKITSLACTNQNQQFTMGLKNYQDIKQAHQKHYKNKCETIPEIDSLQCTFEPKINENTKERRSLQKFISDQEMFLIKKQEKIQQLRTEINRTEEDEATGRPSIDRYSQIMSTHLNSTIKNSSIFERLSKEKTTSSVYCQESLFTPKILKRSKSMKRKQTASTLLYDDAKRRMEKEQFLQNQMIRKRDTTPRINSNTNQLVIKKIQSEFDDLISDQEMTPLVALTVLSEIFNLNLNPDQHSSTEKICEKVLSYLLSPKKQLVLTNKLWHFIQLLVNAKASNNNIYFNEDQERQIVANFQYFYSERLSKERKSVTPEKYEFKPKTLTSSQKMAESFREKKCDQINDFIENQKHNIVLKDGNMTIEDLFILDHLKRQASNQRKKVENQNKALESCTFKPDVSHSSSTLKNLNKKPKIFIKNTRKEELLKTRAVPVLMDMNDCSNVPRSCQKSKVKLKQSTEVKNMQKIVLRMSVARQNRQFSNEIKQRGYPVNENWNSYKLKKQKQVVKCSQELKGYASSLRT